MKTSIALILSAACAIVLAAGVAWLVPNGMEAQTQSAQSIFGFSDNAARNVPAVGVLGGLQVNAAGTPTLTGWAYDPNDQSRAVEVHFYVDGAAGVGTYVGKMTANLKSPDLKKAGVRGDHRFAFPVPEKYRSTTKAWYVYAIDLQAGTPLLSGSGQRLSIPGQKNETGRTYQFSSDFGSSQGTNGWSYKYGSSGSYADMVWDEKARMWKGNESYLQLTSKYFHPGTKADAVAAWIAPMDGSLVVTGTVLDASAYCGDGVTVRILNGSSELWSATIANGQKGGVTHSLTPTVKKGDTLYFVVNRGGNYNCDSTAWNPKIAYTVDQDDDEVSEPPVVPDVPSCTLKAMPATVEKSKATSLVWTTTNGSTISIDQGIGKVSPVLKGSRTVRPDKTTVYTATVENGGEKGICSAQVAVPGAGTLTVSDPITVASPQDILNKTTGSRYIDAVPTTIVNKQTGERYWFNTDSSHWTKHQGTLDRPFQTQLWTRETGGLFGEEPFPFPPDGERPRYWLMNSWQDTNGDFLGFIHVEYASLSGGTWKEGKGRIGLAWSTDYGESFDYLGHIITPYQDKLANMSGVPYFIKDGYFYIYYLDWCPAPSTSVARAKVSDVIEAARKGTVTEWRKYHKGEWKSPGHEGACTALLSTLEGIIHSDASWSTYTNKAYLLLSRGNNINAKTGLRQSTFLKLYESTDGVKWTPAVTITEQPGASVEYGYAYSTIVDETGINNGVVGKRFYVYSDKDAARGGPNGIIQRWTIDLDGKKLSEAEPEEPVESKSMLASVYEAFREVLARFSQ